MAKGPNDSNRPIAGPLTLALALALTNAAGAAHAAAQDMPGSDDELAGILDESVLQDDQDALGFGGSGFESEGFQDDGFEDEFFVELHVNDEDLATVLQMLSIQSQRNIVTSNNVSATVTANLYGVTFYEALDAILHVNGYGYIERGNFIYVYTIEELQEITQASRQRVTEVISLNYLNATDAAEFASPLLSEDGGQIKFNGTTESFNIPDNAPVGADDYAHEAMLVVFDYPENVEAIQTLIGQIDTRPAQVLVEATILQAELSEDNAFGVDFSVIGELNFADFIGLGGPLETTNGLIDGAGSDVDENPIPIVGGNLTRGSVTSNVGNIDGPATLKAGVVSNNVSVFLRMLDEVTNTTILSNPKILSLNRQPARVLVGRKVGFLSTTSTDTSTTQSVEFLDTGTQLYFRPFVTNEGLIRMELKPQVSEAVIRDVTDVQGAVVTIPDEVTNEIVANVMVRDGQTVVLGGLFRESTTSTRRQIPVLGDIPVVGGAFRGHEDDIDRSEIIFMVTPTIVNDEVLIANGEEANEYIEHVRAGSRNGLLPFSRTRQSAQLLVEARELARSGQTDRALHKIQRSLELNPQQPEAIKLRSELNGKREFWPSGSMLQDIYGRETLGMVGDVFGEEQADMFAGELADEPAIEFDEDTIETSTEQPSDEVAEAVQAGDEIAEIAEVSEAFAESEQAGEPASDEVTGVAITGLEVTGEVIDDSDEAIAFEDDFSDEAGFESQAFDSEASEEETGTDPGVETAVAPAGESSEISDENGADTFEEDVFFAETGDEPAALDPVEVVAEPIDDESFFAEDNSVDEQFAEAESEVAEQAPTQPEPIIEESATAVAANEPIELEDDFLDLIEADEFADASGEAVEGTAEGFSDEPVSEEPAETVTEVTEPEAISSSDAMAEEDPIAALETAFEDDLFASAPIDPTDEPISDDELGLDFLEDAGAFAAGDEGFAEQPELTDEQVQELVDAFFGVTWTGLKPAGFQGDTPAFTSVPTDFPDGN
ncbi:MAG: secretin N-terminal domain-containing protein [Planctomycetota bacterium]